MQVNISFNPWTSCQHLSFPSVRHAAVAVRVDPCPAGYCYLCMRCQTFPEARILSAMNHTASAGSNAGLCFRDLCVCTVSLFLLTLRSAAGFKLSCLPFSPCDVWFVTSFAVLFGICSRSMWMLQEYVNACFHLPVNLHLLRLCYLISGGKGFCLLFCVYEALELYVIRCSGPWSLLQDLFFYYTVTQRLQGGISGYCGRVFLELLLQDGYHHLLACSVICVFKYSALHWNSLRWKFRPSQMVSVIFYDCLSVLIFLFYSSLSSENLIVKVLKVLLDH